MNEIFKIWITIFGHPQNSLCRCGEFNSDSDLREFCERLNVKVKTTAAESHWSNELIEKHNKIIDQSVEKVMEDISCSLDVALPWVVSARNALQTVYGFSLNQLVMGKNPNFPIVMTVKPPALEGVIQSELIAKKLGGGLLSELSLCKNF